MVSTPIWISMRPPARATATNLDLSRAPSSPGQAVWVRDLRGSIAVEAERGESLEVVAVKEFSDSDPASVRIVAVPTQDGVAICALWGDACRPLRPPRMNTRRACTR